MIAYVVFITNTVLKRDNPPSPTTIEENAAIMQAVNTSADPCNSFEHYACGHYTEFNAIDPWSKTQIIANRQLTDLVDECENTIKNWSLPGVGHPVIGNPISNNTAQLLLWGFCVNTVSFAITWENKIIKLVIIAGNATEPYNNTNDLQCLDDIVPPTVELENVIVHGNPCTLLNNDTVTIKEPSDYPSTCVEVLSYMQMGRVADAMPIPNISDIVDPIIAAYDLNTSFHLGGGQSITLDINLQQNLSVMWVQQKLAEIAQVGTTLSGPTWAMSANIVNMWYDGDQDAVFVPSGMFFPPMYHPDYELRVLLGTIGFFISHEFGHALDSRRDNNTLGEMLVNRIEQVANTSEMVNVTVHEDIADYYGIQFLEKSHGPLTQLTLLKLGQSFCMESDKFSGDVHAPGRWRVNTTMSFSESYHREWCRSIRPNL